MSEQKFSSNRPLVGFFPLFYNLAETGRALLIAKRYVEQGGKVVFFSHGGKYESLVKEHGFEIIRVKPIYSEEFIDDLWKYSRLEKTGSPFPYQILKKHVDHEISSYKQAGIELVVTTNNFPCSISAREAKIPLVFITPKVTGKFTIYPDDAEFFFTKFLPKKMKLAFLNWLFPRSKMWVRPFKKLGKKYGLREFRYSTDITKGDYTFYSDLLELVQLPRSKIRQNEYFIGPIFLDELFQKSGRADSTTEEIKKHLQKKDKNILLSLGSSGTKEVFGNILEALSKTNYGVIAVYASIFSDNGLPKVSDNILLSRFVPSIKDVNQIVDLAIIHGGQGTVYTAAYAGKPVIGFPMQFEQHLNLEMLVKHGMASISSRKFFDEKSFLNIVSRTFEKYDSFLLNAQKLSKSLPEPKGVHNAVDLIIKIVEGKI
jgi:UDP:flavonoid glycosyltransferase YjiC (YdhE family)